jgi:hypothetical protein
MTRRFLLVNLLSSLSLIAVSEIASAELLATDLIPGTGDDLVVLDTESGLEWLRLTETRGLSVVDVIDNDAGGFADLGFRLASREQVQALFLAGGVSQLGAGFVAENFAPASALIDLLGCVEGCGGGLPTARGWVQAPDLQDYVVSGVVQTSDCCPPAGQAYVLDISSVPKATGNDFTGIFLVSGPDLDNDGFCDNIPWFPLTENASWTYRRVGGGTLTQQIQPTQTNINGMSTFGLVDDEGFTSYFTSDCDGVKLHGLVQPDVEVEGLGLRDASFTFIPPIFLGNAAPGPTLGDSFDTNGSVDVDIEDVGAVCCLSFETTATLEAFESTAVPIGRFDTVRLRVSLRLFGNLSGQAFDETEVDTYWLARDYGIVKFRQEFQGETNTFELTGISLDVDADGLNVTNDNCPTVPDPDQTDTDQDGFGDVCDTDDDDDAVPDVMDVCPLIADPDQANFDGDAQGDACDDDDDNDGFDDVDDLFPRDPQEWADNDGDGIGDNGDPDDDNDGITDRVEQANGLDPFDPNDADQDFDGDGFSNRAELEAGTDLRNPRSNPRSRAAVITILNLLFAEQAEEVDGP